MLLSIAPDFSKSPPIPYLIPIYCSAISEIFLSKISRFFSTTGLYEASLRWIVKMNNIEMIIIKENLTDSLLKLFFLNEDPYLSYD